MNEFLHKGKHTSLEPLALKDEMVPNRYKS